MSETPTPIVETPAAPAAPTPAPAEATTIASHEAQYGRNGTGPESESDDDTPLDDVVDEDTTKQRGRGSRAKSKMAAARINKQAGEIFELRQKLAAIEAKQAPAAAPKQPAYTLPTPPQPLPHEPEPQLEQFADKDDPYGAWQRALAKWDRQQEHLQAIGQQQQQRFQQTAQQSEAYWTGIRQTHMQRLQAAIQTNPHAAQVLQSVKVQPPPVLDLAIMLDDDSAAVAVYLASHPDELDDFVLRTAAQPVTEQTVAITRRLLRQRMSAGNTGSVAPSHPLPTAPRPPNPVRTGPMRTTDGPPADDSSSLKDHERHYGKGKRRE